MTQSHQQEYKMKACQNFKTKESATDTMKKFKETFPKYEWEVEKTNTDKSYPYEIVRIKKKQKYYSGCN